MIYCSAFFTECNFCVRTGLPTACMERSVLELWAQGGELDEAVFDKMTNKTILRTVNEEHYRYNNNAK